MFVITGRKVVNLSTVYASMGTCPSVGGKKTVSTSQSQKSIFRKLNGVNKMFLNHLFRTLND